MDLTTSILIAAPHEVQEIAVPIMQKYAPETLSRVLAHLTVFYPFVPYEQLGEACSRLRAICADVQPFDVTMSGYGRFPGVIFMTPVDPEPIKVLFRKIYAAFPDYPPYGGAYGDDLHPHMTVAEFKDQPEPQDITLPDYAPITFRVERLHVTYGSAEHTLPWITYEVIPLGVR